MLRHAGRSVVGLAGGRLEGVCHFEGWVNLCVFSDLDWPGCELVLSAPGSGFVYGRMQRGLLCGLWKW